MIAPFVIAAGSHPAERLLPYPMSRTGFREVDSTNKIIQKWRNKNDLREANEIDTIIL